MFAFLIEADLNKLVQGVLLYLTIPFNKDSMVYLIMNEIKLIKEVFLS
jgi:hypothetical protein